MFSKAKDYLLQNAVRTIWYLVKTAEGDATFNTYDEAVFKSAANTVGFAVKQTKDRRSDALQSDSCAIYIWRDPWLVNFTAERLPAVSDKLFADDAFWLVTAVTYTDMDDSGYYQRYKLECTAAKGTVVRE